MAIIEVPFDYLTIQAAINASSPGDTILVGSSYGGPETPTVTVNNLTFEINAATSGIVLTLSGVSRVQVNGDGDVNVIGTAANETIVGNTGGNTIFGGLGDDVIDGGTGMDTVDYTATTSAIAVDLGDLIGSNVSGGAGQDTLSNIETVQGTDFADTFRGGINAATFYGNDGNDTFIVSSDINAIGGNDDDIFLFDGSITSYSAGNLSGGSGDDRLRFAGSDGTVIDADVDVTSIEIVEFVGGTNTDQTAIFSGDEFDNPAEFAAALQIIGNNSTGSTDTIQIDMRTPTTLDLSQWVFSNWGGQSDRIVINGDGQDETYVLSTQNETLDGAGGADIVDYSAATSGVTVNLDDAVGSNVSGGSGTDTLSNIENVLGSAFADVLQGTVGTDTLDGGDGNDTLHVTDQVNHYGGNDDDIFRFTTASDLILASGTNLYGGTGFDTVLIDGQNGTVFDFDGDVYSIEAIEFASGSNKDVTAQITGDEIDSGSEFAAALQVTGNNSSGSTEILEFQLAGATSVDLSAWTFTNWGGQGDMIVIKGDGQNETFILSNEDESLDGAGGADIVDYSAATSGVTVNLDDAVGSNVSGGSGTDTLSNIENVLGSAFADVLQGTVGTDTLDGGDGNDTLHVTDQVNHYGGNDDDIFRFTTASDLILAGGTNLYGGTGFDTVLIDGQNGTVFDFDGDVYSIEAIEFASGSNKDVTAQVTGDEIDSGSEFAAALQVTGNNSSGSTEILEFQLAGATSVDLSAWTFTNWGGQGDQIIVRGDGQAETIIGSSQNDTIEGAGGSDSLDGAGGTDAVSYEGASSGVKVDLAITGAAQDTLGAGTDTLAGFENLIGSAHGDTLFGSGGTNVIDAGDGDDIVLLRSGTSSFLAPGNDNTLLGGAGNDKMGFALTGVGQSNLGLGQVFDGGSGIDDFVFETYNSNYRVNLSAGSFTRISDGLKVADVIDFENISAGNGDDELTGDMGNNTVLARGGDDELNGLEGADTLNGGAGMDTINGGDDDDLIIDDENGATSNVDANDGGAGIDTYQATGINWSSITEFNLLTGFQTVSNGLQRDTFTNIENLIIAGNASIVGDNTDNVLEASDLQGAGDNSIFGNDGNDTLIGGGGEDKLYGGDGSDSLSGDDDDDSLYGGSGSDKVYGGAGDDYVRVGGGVESFYGGAGSDDYISYYDSTGGITIDLAANTVTGSWANNDVIDGFESVGGSSTGDDKFYGTTGANRLKGYGGEDSFYAGLGNDKIYGGDGDDYVRVGGGVESFYGGAGDDDYISYYDSTNGINIDLAANTVTGGLGDNDVIDGFESVGGSSTGNDKFYGTTGANRLKGYGGDDSFYAGSGNDKIYGGDGDDYVRAGGGVESFYGGAGDDDYISYYDSSNGITIDLAANTVTGSWANNDVIDGFESVGGSSTGDDKFYGTSGANRLKGYGGEDSFYAGSGSDKVYGGDGDDYVRVGGGVESFYGGAGSDDYISYYDSSGGITIDLAANTVTGSWANNDVIDGFESVGGSSTGDDKFYGTTGANRLKGYGGEDSFYGGTGDDKIYGGSGDDYARVGDGSQSFYGGSGTDDYISYYDSAAGVNIDLRDDTISGSWGDDDTIAGWESAGGSNTGDDKMYGSDDANRLKSYAGNDSLYGRGGDDKMYGGSGEDRFDGGHGADSLYGGSGADNFHFDRGEGDDIVKDFANNEDYIQFDNFSYLTDAASALAFATESGGDVLFDFGADGTLLVENTSKAALANDIEIV